jgi:hypothetical protein
MNVHVIKDGALQRYLMFYEAVAADGSRAIGVAASKDGIRGWKRLDRSVRLPDVPWIASAWTCAPIRQLF